MREHPFSPPPGIGDGAASEALVCGTRTGVRTSAFLETAAYPGGRRTLVTVAGEIDIDCAQQLQRSLCDALAQAPQGLDLDLSRVYFCDCSGLRVLLRLRRLAHAEGKTVRIRVAGPAVARLLMLTGTAPLFAHRDGVAPRMDGNSETALRAEVVDLKRAMRTRPGIDLARGVLMASFGLSVEEAWSVLVEVSQRTNTKLHDLADKLVGAVTGEPLPDHVQRQISAVVADLADPHSPCHHQGTDWVSPAVRGLPVDGARPSA
ncbi:STAS domain-containing protein [Streptomyces sp. NPDC002688]|uniref:STAS domain-containing protein n=1 Tax=Streptomyces sp. NPDC002688 TaxID=3154423 RepID=UPI00331A03CC